MKNIKISIVFLLVFNISFIYLVITSNDLVDIYSTYKNFNNYSKNQFMIEEDYNVSKINELIDEKYLTEDKQINFIKEINKNNITPYFVYNKIDSSVIDERTFIIGLSSSYTDIPLANNDVLVGINTKEYKTKAKTVVLLDPYKQEMVTYNIVGTIKPGISILNTFNNQVINLDEKVVVYEDFKRSGLSIFFFYKTNLNQNEIHTTIKQVLNDTDLEKYPIKPNFYEIEKKYYQDKLNSLIKNNIIHFFSAIIITLVVIELLIKELFDQNNYNFSVRLLLYKSNLQLMCELLLKTIALIAVDLIVCMLILNRFSISITWLASLLLIIFVMTIIITISIYSLKLKIIDQIKQKNY